MATGTSPPGITTPSPSPFTQKSPAPRLGDHFLPSPSPIEFTGPRHGWTATRRGRGSQGGWRGGGGTRGRGGGTAGCTHHGRCCHRRLNDGRRLIGPPTHAPCPAALARQQAGPGGRRRDLGRAASIWLAFVALASVDYAAGTVKLASSGRRSSDVVPARRKKSSWPWRRSRTRG
jgi:hypothetical protein